MARVFVSHASEDRALAREVHRWLVDDGHEAFLDQDLRDGITLGEPWRQRLHERLRFAHAVVCVVTSAYLASTWCGAEVAIAQSRGSRLLPLRAEPEVTHPLLGDDLQHTDLVPDPDTARDILAEVLRRIDVVGGSGWPDDRPPFPGLGPFDVTWHRVSFGRAKKELVELLRSAAERARGTALLVVGPSGCGKSSLVRGTLRPEFLDQLLGDSQLATLPTDISPLRPLHREALRVVIEGPARLAGIEVEDHLVARLVADTASGEGRKATLWDV